MAKRKLTETEIEKIVSFVQPNEYIPEPVAVALVSSTKETIISQLRKIEIYPQLIPTLGVQIEKNYYETLVQPGECVGVITAQSIGERQTQSNLNFFHKAGSSDKQPVVSKFAELLNATAKPKAPSFLIYFKDGNKSVPELRETMGHSIVQIAVRQITKEFEVCVEKKAESWYPAFFALNEVDANVWTEQWQDCLSLRIDMDLLFEYKLKLSEVARILMATYTDMYCVYSPDCFGQLDVFVNTEIDMDVKEIAHITTENKKYVYLEEVVYPTIENQIISGISGIVDRFFVQDIGAKEWFVETQNLQEKAMVKKKFKGGDKAIDSIKRFKTVLSHPRVNMSRTLSNNVWDILHTLGIEATRAYMIREFSQIMDGINQCHISLLVDKMTFSGSISSISRYGMRRDEAAVLNHASFEETLECLLNAGIYCQEDSIKGVSASIICGKTANLGTNMCKLSMNLRKLGIVEEEKETEDDDEQQIYST